MVFSPTFFRISSGTRPGWSWLGPIGAGNASWKMTRQYSKYRDYCWLHINRTILLLPTSTELYLATNKNSAMEVAERFSVQYLAVLWQCFEFQFIILIVNNYIKLYWNTSLKCNYTFNFLIYLVILAGIWKMLFLSKAYLLKNKA